MFTKIGLIVDEAEECKTCEGRGYIVYETICNCGRCLEPPTGTRICDDCDGTKYAEISEENREEDEHG